MYSEIKLQQQSEFNSHHLQLNYPHTNKNNKNKAKCMFDISSSWFLWGTDIKDEQIVKMKIHLKTSLFNALGNVLYYLQLMN